MDQKEEHTKAAAVASLVVFHDGLAGVDELSARVFRAFLGSLRLHRQLMVKTLTARGTHPGQAFCLRLLASNDGISQRDMAETLHLARPTITKMLQAMERGGMIERRTDPDDQRLTRVYLTDSGRTRERALRAVSAEYVEQTIGTLSEDDRRELARLLEQLSESIARAIDAVDSPTRADGDPARKDGVQDAGDAKAPQGHSRAAQ
jgi:DNA-binding MarR family transcriptional regulator